MAQLHQDERARYHRQLLLPQIGEQGQMKLAQARVLIVGAGGLGSPAALYLAAAGVGTIGLVDSDVVDLSNLQRQIIHSTTTLGQRKTQSASARMRDLNPHITVNPIDIRLDENNADAILSEYDLALGCVDNFAARYALNQACVRQNKANIYGSAARFEGQASVFCHAGAPCYQCFFRDPPPPDWRPGPEDMAVWGTMPGIIGCIQATEAVQLLVGFGQPLIGRLLLMDGLTMKFRELALKPDPDCPICGKQGKK